MLKPMGDRVLLERLDGDGREEIRPSGLILPTRDLSLRHGNTHRIPDTFRARVIAVSDGAAKASEGMLSPGVEVLVHTYDQGEEQTLAGLQTTRGLFVRVDDIIGVVDRSKETALIREVWRPALDAMRAEIAEEYAPADYENAPLMGMIPKTKDFEPPEEPASVKDLGFYLREAGE